MDFPSRAGEVKTCEEQNIGEFLFAAISYPIWLESDFLYNGYELELTWLFMARRTAKEMGGLDFCVITGPVLAAVANPLKADQS